MKHFKSNFLIALISLFVCAQLFAGSSQELKQDQQDINQSKKVFRNSVVTFNNLSLAVDFWHDANLKGDRKASDEHMQMICQIIEDDIKATYKEASYAKLESTYSKEEAKAKQNSKSSKKDDRFDYVDDKQDSNRIDLYVKSKQHLFKALKQSNSFGFKYRLLADYQQLLRQEMEQEKIEIAEDLGEFDEDSRKYRK
ncbi:MAG: hypothetical protein DWP97_14215 [Calditrichaeota bacterium]|nr:MAG: hypothetical protein DWP97_14215 [Calditrichota bacterium]